MPKLTRLYTRKGDEGETSLGGGQRVAKDSLRVTAVGTLDELNACLGLALAHGLVPHLAEVLPPIQNELFHLGSDLCFLEEDKTKYPLPQIEARESSGTVIWLDLQLKSGSPPLEGQKFPAGDAELEFRPCPARDAGLDPDAGEDAEAEPEPGQ